MLPEQKKNVMANILQSRFCNTMVACITTVAFTAATVTPPPLIGIAVSSEDAHVIGEKIWKNECGGSLEGLTHWNKGENFASLGIGHFIWYPEGKKELYEDTFPQLLKFLESKGSPLPQWLKSVSGCPWKTREEFYDDIHSSRMLTLRDYLFITRNLQAEFIANQLESALPRMLVECSQGEKDHLTKIFFRLAQESRGLYAMIDYLNFKGLGASKERYKGQGWGLLQVLLRIPPHSESVIEDFVESAKAVLTQRVQNSPKERNEERWIKGWFNRLNTY